MGIGPVPAIRALMDKTGNKLENMDLVEVGSNTSSWELGHY